MKRTILSAVAVAAAIILTASAVSQDVKTKKTLDDGTVVINTTEIGKKIYGYRDTTPVEISIKDGKIVKVVALDNYETPEYFNLLKEAKLFDAWNGLTPQKALEKKVDAVSGATYSSTSVINNVHEGLNYFTGKKGK
ncbi:MAG: FMN-binding protein [Bacteroidales bacterium]|nr:FMN-binding protein [Bacteroidales bacterium]MBR1433698.1 FMN-binding protein [Bacteroidales bacterium]